MALPIFSPFNRPQAVIFPQHCDLLAIQVNILRSKTDINASGGPSGIPLTKMTNLGAPYSPSGIYGATSDITVALASTLNTAGADQTPTDIALSIGKTVVAEGVQNLTGDMVTNLLAWTTGPAREVASTSTPQQQVRGYIFLNLSLLIAKYGANAGTCDINLTCGLYSNVQCWAEAIPHCRTAGFGTPNSLSGHGGITQETAASMGWATAHQGVLGYCKGTSTPPTTGGNTTITPTIGITATKSGTHYVVSMSNSGFSTNTFSTSAGTGSD